MIPVLGGAEEGLVSWVELGHPTRDGQDYGAAVRARPTGVAPLIGPGDTNFRFPHWFLFLIAGSVLRFLTL